MPISLKEYNEEHRKMMHAVRDEVDHEMCKYIDNLDCLIERIELLEKCNVNLNNEKNKMREELDELKARMDDTELTTGQIEDDLSSSIKG